MRAGPALARRVEVRPAVRVTGAGGWDSAAKFTAFLDGLFRRLRSRRRRLGDASPRLESFVFDLNEIDFGFAGLLPSKSNHLHLSRAIWRAARHEVRVLRFRLFTSEQRLRLPDLPLVSHHLTTLELAHVRVNDRVLDFSSCPSLLDLILHRCYIDAVQMSSQSLNRLIMTDISTAATSSDHLKSSTCPLKSIDDGHSMLLKKKTEVHSFGLNPILKVYVFFCMKLI